MYMALKRDEEGRVIFCLRESYRDSEGNWLSRELMELGESPGDYIVYLDERAFYISESVEETLVNMGVQADYDEIEQVFWPFLRKDIREKIDEFGGRSGRFRGRRHKISREEQVTLQERIHLFDRRRLLFMKFFHVNIEPLLSHPVPFLNQALNKSRDEIEHLMETMEVKLTRPELISYLYAIFRMPEHFPHRLTRFLPGAQDLREMDSFFLQELCALNEDDKFLDAGSIPGPTGKGLHPYLQRYLFLYFDTAFRTPGPERDQYRRLEYEPDPSAKEKRARFLLELNLTAEEFSAMSRTEFIRHFRRLAKTAHPDQGGEHDSFIKLQEAFEQLLEQKREG